MGVGGGQGKAWWYLKKNMGVKKKKGEAFMFFIYSQPTLRLFCLAEKKKTNKLEKKKRVRKMFKNL